MTIKRTGEYTVEKMKMNTFPGPCPLFKMSIVFVKSATMPRYKSIFCQQILENLGVYIWSLQNDQKLNDSPMCIIWRMPKWGQHLYVKSITLTGSQVTAALFKTTRASRERTTVWFPHVSMVSCAAHILQALIQKPPPTQCVEGFYWIPISSKKCLSEGWTASSSNLFTQSRQLFTLSLTLHTAPMSCFW